MQSFEELLEKSVARHGHLCAGEGYFHSFEEHSNTAAGFVGLKAHTL